MNENRIELRMARLERQVRILRAALATLVTALATLGLLGASCGGARDVINAKDITVGRLFAEKIFVMDSPTDPSAPRHIGAVLSTESDGTHLVFFDEDGEAAVRTGYSPDIQGMSIMNRQQNSELFVGKLHGQPGLSLFGPEGELRARMRTRPGGGSVEALDREGVVRMAAGVVDEVPIVGVAGPDGKLIGSLP